MQRSPKPWCFICTLGVFRRLSMRVGVHWFGLRLFGATCGSCWLWNHFLNEKSIKLKLTIVMEFGGCSRCCWKALREVDLIEFISQFSEVRCGRYWLLSGFFVAENSNKLQKLGLEGKISWPSMCSHCWFFFLNYSEKCAHFFNIWNLI